MAEKSICVGMEFIFAGTRKVVKKTREKLVTVASVETKPHCCRQQGDIQNGGKWSIGVSYLVGVTSREFQVSME